MPLWHGKQLSNRGATLANAPKPLFDPKDGTPELWARYRRSLTKLQRTAQRIGWVNGAIQKAVRSFPKDERGDVHAFVQKERVAIFLAFGRGEKLKALQGSQEN